MCVRVKYGWVDWFGDWTGGLESISPNYDQSASCILRRMMLVPSNFLPPGHFTLPVPGSYLPFSPSSPRFHRPVRSYQAVPTFSSFFCLLLCPYAFFFFWFCVSWQPGHYALSSLGFFLLLSRHRTLSSASRACGTPPRAVVRGVLLVRSLFRCVEQPRAGRSIRARRYYCGRMAGYAPEGRLAFF